jgi:hypothetical protein
MLWFVSGNFKKERVEKRGERKNKKMEKYYT